MTRTVDMQDVLNLLELRSFSYDLLRRVYLEEPSKPLMEEFQKGIIDYFPFTKENHHIQNGVIDVRNYMEKFQMDRDYDKLHWDYTRLFIGPYEVKAPIWESVYLNKYGNLFQEETIRVRQMYLDYNFVSKQKGYEAEDHLGYELDFLYQLVELAKEKVMNKEWSEAYQVLSHQKHFLQCHLLEWAPLFAKNVVTHTNTDFYKGMAQILVGYLRTDLLCIDELLENL